MTEVELLVGEGVGPQIFHNDELEAAIAIVRLVKASRRRARIILRYHLGKRRGRRVAARLQRIRRRHPGQPSR